MYLYIDIYIYMCVCAHTLHVSTFFNTALRSSSHETVSCFAGISSPDKAVFIPRVDSPLSDLWIVPDAECGTPLKTVDMEARRSSRGCLFSRCYSSRIRAICSKILFEHVHIHLVGLQCC